MGGSVITPRGTAAVCDGSDVCEKLNKVFNDNRQNPKYDAAKAKKNDFLRIHQGTGDYKTLHALYIAVGVEDTPGWKDYLSTLELGDIQRIALARFEGLDRTKKMKTKTHNPEKGDGDHHVHFNQEQDLSYTINSPFVPIEPKDT